MLGCIGMYSMMTDDIITGKEPIKEEDYKMSTVKKYLIMLVIVTITLCSCSTKDENHVLNENKIAVLFG